MTTQIDITAEHLDDLIRETGIDPTNLRRGHRLADTTNCVALLGVGPLKIAALLARLASDLTDMDIKASNGLPDPLTLMADLLADVHTECPFLVEFTVFPVIHVLDEDDDTGILDDGVFTGADAVYDAICDQRLEVA